MARCGNISLMKTFLLITFLGNIRCNRVIIRNNTENPTGEVRTVSSTISYVLDLSIDVTSICNHVRMCPSSNVNVTLRIGKVVVGKVTAMLPGKCEATFPQKSSISAETLP